jgi:hypothetical protein
MRSSCDRNEALSMDVIAVLIAVLAFALLLALISGIERI